MKIIVTGGAGFIGSHIVDAYIKAGHEVVAIDNLSTGSKKYLPKGVVVYKADVTNAKEIEKIFAKERPEVVNHHAALISVADSMLNPAPTYETNVMGTVNVLTAFGNHGSGAHKKFIFPSSAAVYGDPKRVPLKETDPLIPLSPYGVSKLLGEALIMFHANQFGFNYTIFRYANIYGPRQNAETGGVVAKVQAVLERGDRPVSYGDGSNTRDYIYVGDIAQANLLALKKDDSMLVNLGSGKATKDKEVLAIVSAALRSKGAPVLKPFRAGEIHHSTLSGVLAKKLLGWTAKTPLKAGITRTIKG